VDERKRSTMIVYARKPRRRTTPSTHATTPIKAVVTASKPGRRRRKPETVDPEAEAALKARFAKNILPTGA